MHACGCARNRRQETNVLIVSVLLAIVVNLALRSNAQGRIEVVGMRKLIVVGLGAQLQYEPAAYLDTLATFFLTFN